MPKIMYNGKEYPNYAPYRELEGTLTAGQTSITFSDSIINANRTIDYYTGVYGVIATSITVASGNVVFTFTAQATDMSVKVRIS